MSDVRYSVLTEVKVPDLEIVDLEDALEIFLGQVYLKVTEAPSRFADIGGALEEHFVELLGVLLELCLIFLPGNPFLLQLFLPLFLLLSLPLLAGDSFLLFPFQPSLSRFLILFRRNWHLLIVQILGGVRRGILSVKLLILVLPELLIFRWIECRRRVCIPVGDGAIDLVDIVDIVDLVGFTHSTEILQ